LALVHGVVEGSYRKTTNLINRIRHQSAEDGTPVRTLCDTAEGEGQQILVQMERQADRMLQEHHFTPEGVPQDAIDWGTASTTLPLEEVEDAVKACAVPDDWKEEMTANPVAYEDPSSQVHVSMDGVGVKEQKAERCNEPPPKRQRKHPKAYVYTTVAQVDHDEESYVVVGSHTVGVLRLLLAFLLHNGLWKHGLTFLTDGQKTLQGRLFVVGEGAAHLGLAAPGKEVQRAAQFGDDGTRSTQYGAPGSATVALVWLDGPGHPVPPAPGSRDPQTRRRPRSVDRVAGTEYALHPLLCRPPGVGITQLQQSRREGQ
jgi:hypothetical protein